MPRFVILHHETDAGSHYDLMFEVGDVLKTWSLAERPEANRELACKSLPDHRLAYLDYEGPISGGRGSVMRWDQGTYQREEPTAAVWSVELIGDRLRGRAMLSPRGPISEDTATCAFCYVPWPDQ
jgi:hypothetical protein